MKFAVEMRKYPIDVAIIVVDAATPEEAGRLAYQMDRDEQMDNANYLKGGGIPIPWECLDSGGVAQIHRVELRREGDADQLERPAKDWSTSSAQHHQKPERG